MNTTTITTRLPAGDRIIQPLGLAGPRDDQATAFFGAIGHAVAQAYMNYAQGQYGPGVITSKEGPSVLDGRQADLSSVSDLLSARQRNLA